MNLKIKNIASNAKLQSAFVGFLITLFVFFIWDTPIKKYSVQVEPFAHKSSEGMLWFAGDFNGDGTSERVRCFQGINTATLDVIHYDEYGNLMDHYHFPQSNWNFRLQPKICDLDGDGTQELLFFSVRNDSIFINALNLVSFRFMIDHLYFNSFERKRTNYAFTAHFGDFGDFDHNENKELFFYFDAGFGLYPRGIFKMAFPSLKITSSPSEYMLITNSFFNDLNSDGTPEIICACGSPSNASEYKKYTDTMSYITVLDYNLNFVFDPIPMYDQYSTIKCIPSLLHDSIFYALFYSRSDNKHPVSLMVVNGDGKIVNQKNWKNISNPEDRRRGLEIVNGAPYVFFHDVGRFKLTPSLENLPNNLDPGQNFPNNTPYCIDLDYDGWDEWIYTNEKDEFIIINEKSNEEVTFISPLPLFNRFRLFPILKNHTVTKFMVDTGNGYFFFHYEKNPNYLLLYLVYAGVFIISSLLIFLLFEFQRKRIEERLHTEKQLSELQFNSVKNQLNPHFLFNTLNAIAYMINEGKKGEAYDFLAINSRMIQRVMNDAKKIKRSLKDELEFTLDYVNIQKHRFKDKFTAQFIIDPAVDNNWQVPKMCIHTFVENAIKHGFRNTQSGGILKIYISPLPNGIIVTISDNGMGRKSAATYNDTSGNGISIMKDFFRLMEKYHGYEINCDISDLNEHSGTRVELKIKERSKN